MYTATLTYRNAFGDTLTSTYEHEDHSIIYAMAVGAVKGALIGTDARLLDLQIEKVSDETN
jgi:hypothetical protein